MIRRLATIGNGPPCSIAQTKGHCLTAITHRAGTSNLQRPTAALLAISAVLFVAGIVLERAGPCGDIHTDEPPVATQAMGTHVEGGNESAETQPQATGSAPTS
jgi:hypothetical protein